MPARREPQRIFQIHAPDRVQVCVRDFLLDVRAANRAESTVEFYDEKLERFLRFLRDHDIAEPGEITPGVLRLFRIELAQERTPGGVRAHWRAVRAFVYFLVREEIIESNPLTKLRKLDGEQELLEPVTMTTIQALLATCDKSVRGLRDRALLLTLVDSGLRASEICVLNIGDVDLNDGSIIVRRSKSRKARIVFVGRQARKAIAAYLRTRGETGPLDPLWLAYHVDGTQIRLTYHGLREMILRRAKVAGVPAPSLHSFRRAFALALLRNGADVISLSRLMGHGSLAVAQRYLKQLKEDLGAVHAANSPADGWRL